MELSDQIQSVKIRPLGGVNQRVSSVDLPPSEFAEVKGLFPCQNGLLERIWGHKYLHKFDEPVLSICPTYNSSKHILIQTATKRYVTTLDELFGRNTYTSDLTPATSTPGNEIDEEESFDLAILNGIQSDGIAGPQITTSWAKRVLNQIVYDQGNWYFPTPIPLIAGLAANVFTLVAGTYRIESMCCCNGYNGAQTTGILHRLYNESDSSPLFSISAKVIAASSGLEASTPARTDNNRTNHWTFHGGYIELNASCDISIQSIADQSHANIIEGKPASLGENEVYTIIKIWKVS